MGKDNYQSKTQAFIEQYAPMAMEQQQKYGIPASVTLAQAAIESSWGKNVAAQEVNNFFGVHATKGWINSGKQTATYTDSGKPVKFCAYGSVSESFQHHSEFLMQNSRYSVCYPLASTDHEGWAYGICRAGYAARPADNPDKYAKNIESIISQYGLDRYDQMAVEDAKKKGITIGYMRDKKAPAVGTGTSNISVSGTSMKLVANPNGNWHMPLGDNTGEMIVTSGFGYRKQPTAGASTNHNGLDLRTRDNPHQPIYATEDNGKVINVTSDAKAGKWVRVEYGRSDGTKYLVSYAHLDSINVKVGDTVNAGQQLGITGDSGIAKGKPHLHFVVRHVDTKGNSNYIDPTKYLAELVVRGGMSTTLVMKGDSKHTDTLAQYKSGVNLNILPVIPEDQQNMYAKNDQDGDVELTDQQLKNAAAGATAGVDPNNPMSLFQLLFGQGGNNEWYHDTGGGLISNLISSLFMAAITLAMGANKGSNQDVVSAEQQANQPETQEQHNATLLKRQRDSVDPEKLKEMAMMDFDASYPEQKEERGQRIT